MEVEKFIEVLGADFYAGVPDSLLSCFCDYLYDTYRVDYKHHVVAANEGNAVGQAAGYYIATGKIPVVYMQNSGIGNTINPIASLLNEKIYGIPCIFVVGWRGEPGQKDEPQHLFQGEITVRLLEDMGIQTAVITKDTTASEVTCRYEEFRKALDKGKQVAFVIKKGAFSYQKKEKYSNPFSVTREQVIERIVHFSQNDLIVSTTGKASRELFEIRQRQGMSHEKDFLTVGSMGHASSVAMGIAMQRPEKKVWCIDGDGAALMHLGAFSIMGQSKPGNLIHVLINNNAHESVGGMPTAAGGVSFTEIAKGCGYPECIKVETIEELDGALEMAAALNKLVLVEVLCAIGSRADLGRPTKAPLENRVDFENYVRI